MNIKQEANIVTRVNGIVNHCTEFEVYIYCSTCFIIRGGFMPS